MKNIANRIPNSRPDQRTDERRFPPREKQYRGYTVEVPPGGDAVRAYRKIKKMLNWRPTTSLDEGINKFVTWFKKNS